MISTNIFSISFLAFLALQNLDPGKSTGAANTPSNTLSNACSIPGWTSIPNKHSRTMNLSRCFATVEHILGTKPSRAAELRVEATMPRRQRWASPRFSMIEFAPINWTEEEGQELTTNLNSLDRKNLLASAPFTTTVGCPISLVLNVCPYFLTLDWMKSSYNLFFF